MTQKEKGKYIGLGGAILVHVALIAFLICAGFIVPVPAEEGGMPVMLGEVPDAWGTADPSLVDVELEETVALKPETKSTKKDKVKKPEKTEAEKAEEARRLAEAKAERERKEAEEAARRKVAGAFGKGAQMESKGNSEGTGIQGSPTGNAPEGATSGVGGYGTFSLNGRSIGAGGLPKPVYNVQDEGCRWTSQACL